jgi:septal ring factor EnvC (AmiA/AmiB activator)
MLLARHTDEIEAYKAEMARVTSSLTEKINQAEGNLVDLESSHRAHMDQLIATKDSLLAAAETQRAALETDLTEQVTTLKEALAQAQTQLIVFQPPIVANT